MLDINNLTENERRACTKLSELKYKGYLIGSMRSGVYYKCVENDQILEEAKELLDGRDPLKFIVDVMTAVHGVWNTMFLGDYLPDYEGRAV